MFDDLYDAISVLWCYRWPRAEGEITTVEIERVGDRSDEKLRLAVAYKFSVGNDGPYSGESFWAPAFPSVKRFRDAKKELRTHKQVTVRYRSDDPSVNRLARSVWKNL